MTMLAIRKYEALDWERLQAIHDAARRNELALAGLEAAFLPLAVAAEREGLFDYQVAVAELDGEAAGFAAYSEEELAWLYVDPAMSRRGVGRALGRYALERMGRPAAVEVLRGNEPRPGPIPVPGVSGEGDRHRAGCPATRLSPSPSAV